MRRTCSTQGLGICQRLADCVTDSAADCGVHLGCGASLGSGGASACCKAHLPNFRPTRLRLLPAGIAYRGQLCSNYELGGTSYSSYVADYGGCMSLSLYAKSARAVVTGDVHTRLPMPGGRQCSLRHVLAPSAVSQSNTLLAPDTPPTCGAGFTGAMTSLGWLDWSGNPVGGSRSSFWAVPFGRMAGRAL